MNIGRLLLRATVGGFFFGHGTQKLFGWFGGHGPDATGQFFESIGLRPGKRHAIAAGLSEAGGGTLIALGAATPLGAAAITATMLTAIDRVHGRNGPWVSDGGFEYNAVLIAAVIALAETGPGDISIERLRGRQRNGLGWALGALGAGAAAAALVRRSAEAPAGEGVAAMPETLADAAGVVETVEQIIRVDDGGGSER